VASVIRNAQRFTAGDNRYEYDSQGFLNDDAITGTTCGMASGQTLLRLCGWSAVNQGNSLLWLMFFDAATLPANGTVPIMMPYPLRSSPQYRDGDGVQPGSRMAYAVNFKAGIVWAASQTAATLTIDNTASLWVTLWCQ
jgi:hypothetical protein